MRNPFCINIVMARLDENFTRTGDEVADEIHELLSSDIMKPLFKPRVFGIDLQEMMKQSSGAVPFVLIRICGYIEKNGLTVDGLFCGCDEMTLVKELKKSFDTSGDASLENVDVISIGELLKIFFLELPEPLIPPSFHKKFFKGIEIGAHCEGNEHTNYLKSLVRKLPDATFNVLKYFSHFLLYVACHQKHHRMSASYVWDVFGPILFRSSENSLEQIQYSSAKKIVRCFVINYEAIFEDSSVSCTEVLHLNVDVTEKKDMLIPSSIRPIIPMEPLSVVIPLDERSTGSDVQDADMEKSIPVLIVDRSSKKSLMKNIIPDKLWMLYKTFRKGDHSDMPIPLNRKRKERRPSGEDQPPRSSSEERFLPNKNDEEHVKQDQIRRCSSHEEMKLLVRYNYDRTKKQEMADNSNNKMEDMSPSSIHSTYNIRDYSPHPPKPKRREIESFEICQNTQDKSQPLEEFSDMHEVQRSAERFSLFHRNTASKSHYSTHSFNCCCPSPMDYSSVQSDVLSAATQKSTSEGIKIDFFQENNSLNETVIEKNNDQFCPVHNNMWQRSVELYRRGMCTESEIKLSHPLLEQHPIHHDDYHQADDTSHCNEKDTALSLDFNNLSDQRDDDEPLRSEHRYSWPLLKGSQDDDALLSPSANHIRKSNSYEAPLSPSAFKSYLSYRSLEFDPNVPPSPPVEQEDFVKSTFKETEATAATIKQLTKKIHSLKKKIRRFEEEFESEHGFRPSHAEKVTHEDAKKLISELSKARKELKSLKEEESHRMTPPIIQLSHWLPTREVHILEDTTNNASSTVHLDSDGSGEDMRNKTSVEELMNETLKSLTEKRKLAHRPEIVEDMSTDEVLDEKLAIQRALLRLESIHGRPSNKLERDIVRPLYDRYRSVKRILFRSFSHGSVVKNIETDLQPILEHEAMDFTSPQHRTSSLKTLTDLQSEGSKISDEVVSEPQKKSETEKETNISTSLQILAAKYNNSTLHELPFSELLYQQHHARSEKRRLHKVLREFEEEFQKQSGRKVQKEDRLPMETVYAEYKHLKARLRLLEALVSKHELHRVK